MAEYDMAEHEARHPRAQVPSALDDDKPKALPGWNRLCIRTYSGLTHGWTNILSPRYRDDGKAKAPAGQQNGRMNLGPADDACQMPSISS